MNLRPNPDRLEQALKTRTTVAAVIAACRQCEQEWNERRPGNRAKQSLTPLQRYTAGQVERPTLSLERLAGLLYQKRERPVRYTANGLQIEVGGQTYAYEPQQANGDLDRAAHGAANGHKYEVWERRDGNRCAALVRRADGRGEWQEMAAKYAFAEAIADAKPGDAARLRHLLTANDAHLQADLDTARAVQAADEAPADLGQADMGLRLGKDSWNAANAAAEVSQALPNRKRSAGKPTPTLEPIHPSMCGADWNSGPTERPPPSLALAT
ncbi:MAG: hypothetical protein WKG07_01915 [Hymenobacter sp.]